MDAKGKLEDIIAKGVALDLFDAEEVFALDELIGLNADRINAAKYGAFAGTLQRYLGRQLILSVAKLYERPRGYAIRSIPVALDVLRENSTRLEILQKPRLVRKMVQMGYESRTLAEMSDSELTMLIVNYFDGLLPNLGAEHPSPIDTALDALKTVRDKTVAHHEAVSWGGLPKPTYAELRELIEKAKAFVALVGEAYLSIVYMDDDGSYLLSSDANRASRCLARMYKKLGI